MGNKKKKKKILAFRRKQLSFPDNYTAHQSLSYWSPSIIHLRFRVKVRLINGQIMSRNTFLFGKIKYTTC